ncbi:hypothetical protein K458DRAFT_294214 [Lentithecium fluviatile CBS 122367]|uniref:Transcriptional regulator n=1 Tax=Lentithecium fluviatile CBS 122367 TaxID=1168545 RepID=A0A6G1JCV7_9PLEO|nr:hypothetical protein K458DRAFT_294214 [Lentithecium fluviatile CBS 122367]
MSGSEADIRSEASISRALRDVVIAIYKAGNEDDLTVKRVRIRTEKELGLPEGFLKSGDWKQKSDDLIREAVDRYCRDESTPPTPKPKPSPVKKAPPKKATNPKPQPQKKVKSAEDGTRGVKRKAAAPARKPQKKRKKTASSDEESEPQLSDIPAGDQPSDAESEPPKKAVRRQKKVITEESDEEESPRIRKQPVVGDKSDEEPEAVQDPLPDVKADGSDSDMSSLIDESPVKKQRQKKAPAKKSGKDRKPKATKVKATPKSKAEDDPDQAEVKRLQSWLVKCGIRKVWGRELANCDTPKEKIGHLKGMLLDVGMDGKYSIEKATKIKEDRELAKDLEEIQARNRVWGEPEKTDTGRPRRKAANRPIPKPVLPSDSEDEDQAHGEEDGTDDDDDDIKEDSEGDEDDDVEDSDSE